MLSFPSEARDASVGEIHSAAWPLAARAQLAAIGGVYVVFSLSRFRRVIFGD
jgi:hypothetical protein